MLSQLLLPFRSTRQWSTLIAAVLTVPFAIVTVAFLPAMVVCPFLPDRYQRFVLRLLAGLRRWAEAIMKTVYCDTS